MYLSEKVWKLEFLHQDLIMALWYLDINEPKYIESTIYKLN